MADVRAAYKNTVDEVIGAISAGPDAKGVFRVGGVPEHVTAEVVYPVLVFEDQMPKGRSLTLLKFFYKLRVIRPLPHLKYDN